MRLKVALRAIEAGQGPAPASPFGVGAARLARLGRANMSGTLVVAGHESDNSESTWEAYHRRLEARERHPLILEALEKFGQEAEYPYCCDAINQEFVGGAEAVALLGAGCQALAIRT